MGLLNAFKLSLLLPKKKAVYQLNRVKTKDFLLYILLLHVLFALPNGVSLIVDFMKSEDLDNTLLLAGFLYPLLVIMTGTIIISLLAMVGVLVRWMTKRKLVYQLLWKMAMYACTYPVILYVISSLLHQTTTIEYIGLLLLFLIIFTKMILTYPQMKK
ncbi:DUF1189 family protein [Psychrobacillus sp.]|uniref:DUF1189 family protein n=1 Tax=Psychrobacillus sp. TaxID=1871623 RepID=UPI0028BF22B4|nr:DUF1189 family protein [Psychrobacillus sp.]